MSDAFCLNCSVKPFYMGIVIGPMQSTMPRLYASLPHLLLKVATVLWPIVGLHHGNGKPPLLLCFKYCSYCQPWAELRRQRDPCHSGEQVDDRVIIQPSASLRVNMVNSVCLYEFPRSGRGRTSWVISSHAIPSTTSDARPPQNTSDTTQRNRNT